MINFSITTRITDAKRKMQMTTLVSAGTMKEQAHAKTSGITLKKRRLRGASDLIPLQDKMSLSGSETIFHRSRGAPVDCHVLHFGEPDHYLDQCLASLESEPVNVLIVRGGFHGNIGAARSYAVSLGSAPYWTFVDADDWIAPGIAERCTYIMDGRPELAGVYTDYRGVSPDGDLLGVASKQDWTPMLLLSDCWAVLHYHQYRRSMSMRYMDGLANAPCYEETYIAGMLARHGDFLHLNEVGYFKRDGGQSIRLQDAKLLRRICKEIAPALLEAHRRWTARKLVA